jgi:hypothetical protein
MLHRFRSSIAFFCLLSPDAVCTADQLAIWTFPALSGIGNGSSVSATAESLTGTPGATIRNSDIYASGQTGTSYTDTAAVAHGANKALGWSDFKKSGQSVDGQLDLAFNATGRSSMSLRFDYKHNKDNDSSENKLQLRFSTNGGSSFGTPVPFTATDNNTWKAKSFALPASLDGQANVVVRIEEDDSTTNATEVNNILLFDNIELTGTMGGGSGGGQSPVLTITSSSASIPASNPAAFCSAIGDTADAARTAISISPADADTADASLTASVASSNPSVATGSLTRSSSGGQDIFALTLNPLSVGYANITVTIADPEAHSASYTINYAVSAASSTPATSRYHAGASDASSAIALDADWMLVANDEDQIIRLFDRNFSGQPVKTFDLNANLALAKEADFEGTVRFGNRIYFIGSHGNDKDGNPEPTRNMVCSYDVAGTGSATTLTYVNKFTNLKSQLIAWDSSNGHGLGSNAIGLSASAASGVLPTDPEGFNIEAATPSGSQVLLGFRAPLQNKTARNKALVIPVTNFQARVDAGSGTMTFGAPIFLDLGGRAIRSMATMPSGKILILAGLPGESADFQLYSWTGNASSAPVAIATTLQAAALNGGGSPEAIVDPPAELAAGSQIQIIQDNGTTIYYGDGTAGKDLATRAFAKSRSNLITITSLPDETAPVLTLPAAITREASGPLGTPVTFSVSALDAVQGPVAATAIPASGSIFPLGTTTVNVTTSDSAGNTANGSFTITVVDTTAPVLTLPADLSINATSAAGANVQFDVSAIDAVGGILVPTASPASGSLFPIGSTQVMVSVADPSGNAATASFTILVSGSPKIHVSETGGATLADNAAPISLGNVILGSAGLAKSFTIRNDGTAALTLGTIMKDGDHPADFTFTAAAATFLAPGATTEFTVTFSPKSVGTRAAILRLPSNDPDPAMFLFEITLTGTGVAKVPPTLLTPPVMSPPSGGGGAKFSANVAGPPGSIIRLEASTDFGLVDPWVVIAQITLDSNGHGAFTDVVDPGTVGTATPANFYRLRAD